MSNADDTRLARLRAATAGLDAPFAVVDVDAMWRNADDLLRRAGGDKPIRVASKSLRVRSVLDQIAARDARFQGLLCFTLPEALWLASLGWTDLLVGYPTADRGALRALADLAADGATTPVIMVDDVAHLDLITHALDGRDGPVEVCIDIDAGLHAVGGNVKIGPKRSPVHSVEDAVVLARAIVDRPGIELVAVMGYEGHIAGVGDEPGGNVLVRNVMGPAIRAMQKVSSAELIARRGSIVAAVREVTELRFVNGGGTGSLEMTSGDPSVTELAAGSGFFAPHLFDHYGHFTLTPSASFALPIVRRPGPGVATALGGGYLASGVGDATRLPIPWLPAGLKLDGLEGAGEVQTPLLGDAADDLAVGDTVFLRHCKAGELSERFASVHLISGDEIVDEVPTYRGEGQTFL